MLPLTTILIFVAIILCSSVTVYGLVAYSSASITNKYNLYNHYYVEGVQSQGAVLATNNSCRTSLQCSNIFALNKDAKVATFDAARNTCTLHSNASPFVEDESSTVIARYSSESTNGVSNWDYTEGARLAVGDMFCSNALANTEFAAALCAATPECAGYTLETNPNDSNRPCGCLKYANVEGGFTDHSDSRSLRLYGGARKDAVATPASAVFSYDTTLGLPKTPALTSKATTLSGCANLAVGGAYAYGVHDATTNTCLCYTDTSLLPKIAMQKYKTLITKGQRQLSNNWTNNGPGTDLAGDLTQMAGYGTLMDVKSAIFACANASPTCKGFTIDTNTGLVYFKSTDVVSRQSVPLNANCYTPPAQ
jgi:hypothetical protein